MKHTLQLIIALMMLLAACYAASAQMTVETFTLKATGDKITFLKYLPSGYDKTKKYPVLVSLSGDGEKASYGIASLQGSGINRLLISGSLSLPFIVVSPQTPYANYDVIGNTNLNLPGVFATEMLDTAIARYNGDPNRTYITGLSMGGPSVPNAMGFFPSKWAAGISMASWETDLADAALIKGALWDIKVDQDGTAGPPDYNIQFIQACKSSAKAQYTVIQGVCHCIWDQVYSDTWEGMGISTKYSGSTPQSNIYTWLSQFTTSGAVAPSQVPVPVQTSTTWPIPGRIEAENYSAMSGINTEPCLDSSGGKDVGWIDAGDWMDYPVNVSTTGIYNVSIRYASTSAGVMQFRNSLGVPLDTIAIPVTGGWQKWATLVKPLTLGAGNQTLRIYAQKAGFNLNWFDIQPSVKPLPSVSITCPASITVKNPSGASITVSGQTFTGDFVINVK